MNRDYTLPSRRRRRWVFLAIGCCAAALALAHAAARHARSRWSRPMPVATLEEPPFAPDAPARIADQTALFSPDVYASKSAALRGALRNGARWLATIGAHPRTIGVRFLNTGAKESSTACMQAIAAQFSRARRVTELASENNSELHDAPQATASLDSSAPNFLTIEARMESHPADQSKNRSENGSVNLHLQCKGVDQWLETHYVLHEWVDDLASYAADNPGDWLVAASARICLTPAEARNDANRQAAAELADRAIQVFGGDRAWGEPMRPRLASVALQEIASGQCVADRFLQRFHRPYGDVWSEAVLIDARQTNLSDIAARAQVDLLRDRASRHHHMRGVAAVLVLILLTYFFLNMITRHYFTARLRAGAILLAIGVVMVAVIYLARRGFG